LYRTSYRKEGRLDMMFNPSTGGAVLSGETGAGLQAHETNGVHASKNCESCGHAELPADSAFCPFCGARLAPARVPGGDAIEVPTAFATVSGALITPSEPSWPTPEDVSPYTTRPDGGSAPAPAVAAQTSADETARPALAGFWRRLGARALDGVIVAALGTIPAVAIYLAVYEAVYPDYGATDEDFRNADAAGTWAAIGFYTVLGATYATIGWSRGGTWGMRALGLRMETARFGERPGVARAFTRWLVSVLSWTVLGLGCLAILWDKKRQTWHDAAAGTVVIEER
jgi:uncharacterized RDD family membrane protein YckC